MSTASLAIGRLVSQVRQEVATGLLDERQALARILSQLDIAPGDSAWANGRDVVGEAFERLAPTTARRELGQYFTPLWVARPMAEWLLSEPTDLLLDPGVGSGSLLIGAAQTRKDRDTRLLGLDVDPLALKMAQTTRHVREIEGLELRLANFLLDDLDERPQAIICNPPYTRHQELPPELKDAIHDGLSARLEQSFSRLASLHVLFLLRALEISADDARIAFLTPAHWMDMNYAREVKTLLLERAHVEALVSFPVKSRVFDHAITTAGVTLIRKGVSGASPTRIVRLQARASTEARLRAAIKGRRPYREVVLRRQDKWSRTGPRPKATGVKLSDLANVRRGLATGCNAFFVLTEARRRELKINKGQLVPCIASPRHFSGATLRRSDLDAMDNDVPRWLLKLDKAPRSGPMASYLARGRTEFEVRDRTLVRQRQKAGHKWFQLDFDLTAPILFRYFNVSRARFVRNVAKAVPLNNWLLIQPKVGVDADELFAVLQELGKSTKMEDESRHYGKGLWKLEPRELGDLVLPEHASALLPSA